MSRNQRVKCPSSPHSLMFRRMDAVIRADHWVKQAFETIQSWQGEGKDLIPPTPDNCPHLRLTPSQAGDEWYGPSGFSDPLQIECEIAVAGTNAEDAMDLVHVLRRAFYPADGARGLEIQKKLQADRLSPSGQPKFTAPGFRPDRDAKGEAMTIGSFLIQIPVIYDINP